MRERGKKAFDWLPNSNRILLDLGCGVGEFTGYYLRKATFVFGCDISLEHLRKAQRMNPSISFVLCACENLPFKKEMVDAVVFTDVLEHIDNKNQTIQEIFRVMREGAHMCLSVPYKGTFWFLDVENFKYYIGFIKNKINPKAPHKHFPLDELKELLKNFKIIKYSRSGCLINPVCLYAYRVTKLLRITFLDRFIRYFADIDYSVEYGKHAFNIMLLAKKNIIAFFGESSETLACFIKT